MLTKLKKLNLSRNNLSSMENVFDGLTCLEELHINHNKITLALNTLNLTKLKVLNISFNPLNQINYSFFEQLISLKTINYSSEQKKMFDYMLFNDNIKLPLRHY